MLTISKLPEIAHGSVLWHRSNSTVFLPDDFLVDAIVCNAGNYTASAWRAIDYIIARAGQYGIKLIYVVADNWQQADSVINVSLAWPSPGWYSVLASLAPLCIPAIVLRQDVESIACVLLTPEGNCHFAIRSWLKHSCMTACAECSILKRDLPGICMAIKSKLLAWPRLIKGFVCVNCQRSRLQMGLCQLFTSIQIFMIQMQSSQLLMICIHWHAAKNASILSC